MFRAQLLILTRLSILLSFGGTDCQYHYNDTWTFDTTTNKWSELTCIGFTPSPREGHAAAIVDDVVYVFGGRGVDGKDLGDLGAFKLSSACRSSCAILIFVLTLFRRPAMVHVPEDGSCADTAIWTCDGLYGLPGVRPRRHWRRVCEPCEARRSHADPCAGYQ